MNEAITKFSFSLNVPSFGYKIYIRNETSHTQLSKPELINPIEFKEQGIVLELPLNVCQKGHLLTLFFVEKNVEMYNKRVPDSGILKEASFHAMVKVESLDSVSKERQTNVASLNFTQYDTEHWKKILESFSVRQEDVTQKIMLQHLVRDKERGEK